MRLALLVSVIVSGVTLALLPACSHPVPGPLYQADVAVFARPGKGARMCADGADGDMPRCPAVPLAGWHWSAVTDGWVDAGVREARAHLIGRWDGQRFHVEEADRYMRPPVLLQRQGAPGCPRPAGGPADAAAPAPSADPAPYGPDLVDVWVSDRSTGWNGPPTLSLIVRPGGAAAAEQAARRSWAGPLCVTERNAPTWAQQQAAKRAIEAESRRWHLVRAVLNPPHSTVVATVLLATPAQHDEARRRWGDAVALSPTLQPVAARG